VKLAATFRKRVHLLCSRVKAGDQVRGQRGGALSAVAQIPWSPRADAWAVATILNPKTLARNRRGRPEARSTVATPGSRFVRGLPRCATAGSYQNTYFNPNWTMRLPLPVKILPELALGDPPSLVSAIVEDGVPRLK
jgi:hypothetical protein